MPLKCQPAIQRWLQQHCESAVSQVRGGLVMACASGPEPAQPLAEWPALGELRAPLAAAARAAMARLRPVMAALGNGGENQPPQRVISVPLRANDRLLGAVALAVNAGDSQAVGLLFQSLSDASADVSAGLAAELGVEATPRPSPDPAPAAAPPTNTQPRSAPHDLAALLPLQAALLRHATLADGGLAMVTALAAHLACERVALGVCLPREMALVALSNSAEFAPRQALLKAMADALREAAEQAASVRYPAAPADPVRITLAHAALHASQGGHALASVPLVHDGRVVGGLLLEGPGATGLSNEALAWVESLACLVAPLVALRQQAERGWPARLAQAWREAAWPRAAGVAVLALGLGATLWPVRHHVGAHARLEGLEQRQVSAPVNGFLHKSLVRPGDTVRAGDLLAELADQDLQLEQNKLESAIAQHENSFAAALARTDRAQLVISQGKLAETRAQLELVRQQLARTRLVAPIDGLVIKGDLSQSLGAPVQRGDPLLTLAPARQFRLIVEVDERDIAMVQPGQTGQLALAALPTRPLSFEVTRVTPVATVLEGRNVFEVEARLADGTLPELRPGLQGVAKIEAGRQPLAWIWGHRALDWLRLAWWTVV